MLSAPIRSMNAAAPRIGYRPETKDVGCVTRIGSPENRYREIRSTKRQPRRIGVKVLLRLLARTPLAEL
jgi:hypothetical protein